MASRVWSACGAALVLIVIGAAVSAALGHDLVRLRSEHARPAASVPGGPIVVTDLGKTFHRPGCLFLHGPARAVTAVEAIRAGYTPCVRCMINDASGHREEAR